MISHRLDAEVIDDLADIVAWYEDKRAGLGDDFLQAFWEAVDRICDYPLAHPEHETGLRYFLLSQFPYWIIYEANPDHVLIAAVIHTSRGEKYRDDRLKR